MLFCCLFSFAAFTITHIWLKKKYCSHIASTVLTVLFYCILSVWGGLASYRHYIVGDQMLVFFTVQMVFICFVTLRPVSGMLLIIGSYSVFYWVLYQTNGAGTVDIFNYAAFALLAACGTVSRYHLVYNLTGKSLHLQENNQKLLYVSRHDGLTGVRNRAAFKEDQSSYYNHFLVVIMTDIDYFKRFNDIYGHAMGDEVMFQISKCIAKNFPTGHTYRYGGDEFLILIRNGNMEEAQKAIRRCQSEVAAIQIENLPEILNLSIGIAAGTPIDRKNLMAIIAEADEKLYQIKRSIHQND